MQPLRQQCVLAPVVISRLHVAGLSGTGVHVSVLCSRDLQVAHSFAGTSHAHKPPAAGIIKQGMPDTFMAHDVSKGVVHWQAGCLRPHELQLSVYIHSGVIPCMTAVQRGTSGCTADGLRCSPAGCSGFAVLFRLQIDSLVLRSARQLYRVWLICCD